MGKSRVRVETGALGEVGDGDGLVGREHGRKKRRKKGRKPPSVVVAMRSSIAERGTCPHR